MSKQIERRFLQLTDCDLRSTDTGHELTGYASVFNTESVIAGLYREEVAPGAFAKTIKEHDIRALWNHDSNIVLGRNKAGTLSLSEDSHGLRTVIKAPDNEWGRPVVDAVKRGDITGMSIMFRAIKQEWTRPDEDSAEMPKRTLREAKLFEVSPVTFPAFPTTSIGARSNNIGQGQDEDDVIELARRLVRCAELGMALTRSDRELIAAACEVLRSQIPTEPEADAHHSAIVQAGEPEAIAYHSAWRARELELIELSIN